ncbi:cell division protein ZapA [Candidatus Weimeria sp. HCP3S3_B5]|uniref:cell division protein ZapA n=1 Tax=Candidatus Weimeria sp. HCP3S3_B5 TaxID=3438871 RepID=UPI002A9F78F9|nr:cell division protein ZapA [Lachnospiraceae bacterium]MDY6352368.1 cell division protein ZapA [Lachnospiraceae bacterium]
MSAKKSTTVVIGGRVYTLSGFEDEEYLQRVATYINNKIDEFTKVDSYRKANADQRAMVLELNIADDYFKMKEKATDLETQLSQKDKELYDLKHQLITNQVDKEDLSEREEALKKENEELKAIKEKLESSLADALLGPASDDQDEEKTSEKKK